jgi:hypothetical protein
MVIVADLPISLWQHTIKILFSTLITIFGMKELSGAGTDVARYNRKSEKIQDGGG